MKLKSIDEGGTGKAQASFAAKVVLAGSLMAACSPNVNIKNIPYDPTAPDAGCTSVSSCAKSSLTLRPSGNSAGSSEASIGAAKLVLVELKDSGSTKLATMRIESCDKTSSNDFVPGASAMLTAGKDNFLVTLVTLSYDGAGAKLEVTVQPVCPLDGAVAPAEAGNKG